MATKNARKMREIESDFVTLGADVSKISGTILSRDTVTFRTNGEPTKVGRYLLEMDDGREVKVLGATTLDDKMARVPDGAYVTLVYKGTGRTSSGRNIKEFGVFVEDPDGDVDNESIEAAPVSAASGK